MQQRYGKKFFNFEISESRKLLLLRLSFLTGVIIFLIIMIIYGTYGMHKSSNPSNYMINAEYSSSFNSLSLTKANKELNKEFIERSGCIALDCRFICVNSFNLSHHLEKTFQETNCTTIDNLQVESQYIENSTLDDEFLNINYTIRELAITNLNLTHIENEVFNNEIFTNTFTLTLQTPELQILPSGMLLGLTKLEYLTISSEINQISRVFLQPVRSTLKYLKINGMTENVQFPDIFGISTMSNLYHLDASKNYFTNSIKNSTFILLPKLQYLNLADSNINKIEEDAFKPVWDTLKFLDISENKLTKIYDLKSSFQIKPIYMHVRDNDWDCNCDLLTFVNVFNKYRDHFMDIPYCRYPQKFYGKTINEFTYICEKNNRSDVEFITTTDLIRTSVEIIEGTSPIIDEETSTITPTTIKKTSSSRKISSTSTTISTTIRSTTELSNTEETSENSPINIMSLKCLKHDDFNRIARTSIHNAIIKKQSSTLVEPPIYEFRIQFITINSIQITIEESDMNIDIIWFNDPSDFKIKHISKENIKKDYGCIKRENESIIIENLKENTTYTICLIQDGSSEITPFHCSPLYIPLFTADSLDDNLNNDENALIISIVCLIIIISIGLGGVLSFYVIKNYPDLLEGSKNVLVVKDVDDKSSLSSTLSLISNQNRRSLNGSSSNWFCNKNRNTKQNVITTPIKKTSPFMISRIDFERDSAYETPINSSLDYPISLQSDSTVEISEISNENIVTPPPIPPPLPKRNSEPIYGTINSPVLKPKRN